MIKKITSTPSYLITGVEKVNRINMNPEKQKENQNRERRKNLEEQKEFLESIRKERDEKSKIPKTYVKRKGF